MTARDLLIISNMEESDELFGSDVGTWNVTRAQRDCEAGKHKAYVFEVAECLRNSEKIEVDPDKIASMVADPERLYKSPCPILAIENGLAWLIDGHHRLRALHQLGHREFLAFVIEEAEGKPYRVYFNGKRVAPEGLIQ